MKVWAMPSKATQDRQAIEEVLTKCVMQGWAQWQINGKDLTEAEEIKKMWKDYTEKLYKKRY